MRTFASALIGIGVLGFRCAYAQSVLPVQVDVEAELKCSLPALSDAGIAYGAGFGLILAPAVIAWGGAVLVQAIRSVR